MCWPWRDTCTQFRPVQVWSWVFEHSILLQEMLGLGSKRQGFKSESFTDYNALISLNPSLLLILSAFFPIFSGVAARFNHLLLQAAAKQDTWFLRTSDARFSKTWTSFFQICWNFFSCGSYLPFLVTRPVEWKQVVNKPHSQNLLWSMCRISRRAEQCLAHPPQCIHKTQRKPMKMLPAQEALLTPGWLPVLQCDCCLWN